MMKRQGGDGGGGRNPSQEEEKKKEEDAIQMDVEEEEEEVYLPPEVKQKILALLPVSDLGSVRLLNKTWEPTARVVMEKRGSLDVNFIPDWSRSTGNWKVDFKALTLIRPKVPDPRPKDFKYPATWSHYGDKVLGLLERRVMGGGGAITELVLGEIMPPNNNYDQGGTLAWWETLFSQIPNVQKIRVLGSDSFWNRDWASFLRSTNPVITNKLTKVGVIETFISFDGPLGKLFASATPNVHTFIASYRTSLCDRPSWPGLKKIHIKEEECEEWVLTTWNIFWDWANTVPALSNSIGLTVLILDSAAAKDLGKKRLFVLMQNFKDSLEVLKLDKFGARMPDNVPPPLPPVMSVLKTLVMTRCSPEAFRRGNGSIFGDLVRNPGTVGSVMRLDTHFPVLETLRITMMTTEEMDDVTPCLFFLLYFPPLLRRTANERQTCRSLRNVELPWPGSGSSDFFQEDWAVRVKAAFPHARNKDFEAWEGKKAGGLVQIMNGDEGVEEKFAEFFEEVNDWGLFMD